MFETSLTYKASHVQAGRSRVQEIEQRMTEGCTSIQQAPQPQLVPHEHHAGLHSTAVHAQMQLIQWTGYWELRWSLHQANSSSKQMHPDPARAQPLSAHGADAGILLTLHQRCPWAEDPVDQTAGHAVENAQGTACISV